jgi:Smr domain
MTTIEVDLHGWHPRDICGLPLIQIVEQAWRSGANRLSIIHGHGWHRGGCVFDGTGYLGSKVRRYLRRDDRIRRFVKHGSLDCSNPGVTSVNLKPNPRPRDSSFSIQAALPPSSVYERQA